MPILSLPGTAAHLPPQTRATLKNRSPVLGITSLQFQAICPQKTGVRFKKTLKTPHPPFRKKSTSMFLTTGSECKRRAIRLLWGGKNNELVTKPPFSSPFFFFFFLGNRFLRGCAFLFSSSTLCYATYRHRHEKREAPACALRHPNLRVRRSLRRLSPYSP